MKLPHQNNKIVSSNSDQFISNKNKQQQLTKKQQYSITQAKTRNPNLQRSSSTKTPGITSI